MMRPKGSFPVRLVKPDGSFPTAANLQYHSDEGVTCSCGKPAKGVKSITKSFKMMNTCFRDAGRVVHPMSSCHTGQHPAYKTLSSLKDEGGMDALPLLMHVESRDDTLDFSVDTY